jgi:DNA-binding transcriptional LysR family regulator
MKTPDLRKLNHAVVLAEENTFVRASKRLHISQPALTRSIQALERELGILLFDRQLGGATPTSQGAQVLEYAKTLLEQSQLFAKEIDSLSQLDNGDLAFGIAAGIQNPLLDHLLVEIYNQSSLQQIEIEIEPMPILLELLRKKSIEFFIGDKQQIRPSDRKQLQIEKLTLSRGGFFVRPDHPLATLVDFPLHLISSYPRIAARTDDNEWRQQGKFERMFMETDSPRRGFICNDSEALKNLAFSTNAILVTTDAMVSVDLNEGKLVELQFKNPGFNTERDICLITTPKKSLSQPAKLVIDKIRSIIDTNYHFTFPQ